MERFKIETGHMKGAPECMRISGFMQGINYPELTKRLNEHVPKTMEEMMIATTAFIREEAAAASKKKGHGGTNRFTPLTRTPKEILVAEANKFQPPPPMVTLVEKRNNSKFCDFHNDKRHNTDECMQLKKQIEDGETTWPLGQLRLLVTIGDITHSTKAWMNFMIVKSLLPYNGIIGRPGLKAIQAVPSTVHGMLKFPTEEGIVTIRSSLLVPAECMSIDTSSPIPREKKTRPANLTVHLHPNFSDQELVVGGSLSDKGRTEQNNSGTTAAITTNNQRAEKSLPLFQTLKKCIKKSDFRWTTEAEQAFQQLKQHLSDLPLLAAPKPQEELIMYLSATHGDISAVLMTKRGIAQTPVYFISRALQGPKLNYSPMEKLVLSLVFAAKRLRRFFQAHPIMVITDQPIKQVMSRPDVAGRLQKWSIMLGERNITYRPRTQVPRSRNKKADALSKIASTSFAHLSKQVLVEVLETKSIIGKEVTSVIEEEGPTWMMKLVNYLKEGILPGDKKEARKLRLKARQYELMEGILYRRSFLTPWLRCVGPLQAEYVMKEIHEGSCSMHAGPRSIVAKAIRLGYFWLTMHKDAQDMIRKCSDLGNRHSMPLSGRAEKGQILDSRNGLLHEVDRSKGGGNDYRRTGEEIRIGQYCMPLRYSGEIISDNCKQFADNPFKDWCDKLNITQRFASVKHPRSNELVERANKSPGEGIKARLGEGNKNWVEELPHVLWAHRTMIKSSHGNTPFSLTYGTEAVIPTEIEMPTYRTTVVDVVNNDGELRLNFDLLEERRELAAMSEAKSKSKMMKYYNYRVRSVAFKPGDFVYCSNDASQAVAGGKLGPKWEGPYEVTDALGNGAYKLRSTDGTMLLRTWNVTNLKRCYL
nr:reverse transcriptase domain-containing protein [Tanacetum cinerariifolium]